MRRLDAAARELEAQKRQKAMDISGNKLDLSGEARKNKVIVFQTKTRVGHLAIASSALSSQTEVLSEKPKNS